jgi:acetate kinase
MAKVKILVLNSGSSSIKCCIYDFSHFPERSIEPAWKAEIRWKNIRDTDNPEWEKELRQELLFKTFDCVGHRIVHGGKNYTETVKIDDLVKKEIRALSALAPLHNISELENIEILEKLFPSIPQFAVFDTAFHRTLPQAALIYPGPFEWTKLGIRRYGFHGISFQYCARRAEEMLGEMPNRMVVCHLGSGASLCALLEGQSIDTTMGFTPLEGLMMDTRSGTVDPGLLLYLLEKGKRTVGDLSRELYEKSGLLGLSGISSDMRDILAKATAGDPRAQLAIDVYLHRLVSMIGSMIASLGGIDALVFTAGIGENALLIRARVCDRLSFLGLKLEENLTSLPQKCCIFRDPSGDRVVSSPASKVKILVIHTQEAFEIARECWKLITH